MEGAKKVGIPAEPIARNIKDCALTGHCLSGLQDRSQAVDAGNLPALGKRAGRDDPERHDGRDI